MTTRFTGEQRRGKIARIPHVIRIELNQKLLDGLQAPEILSWLNALPEVQAVLKKHFGGQPVKPQNLSDWRKGGFEEWKAQLTSYEEARRTTDHAQYLCATLGLDPSNALSMILTGHLVRLMSGDATPEDLQKMGGLLFAVTDAKRVSLDEKKVAQRDKVITLNQEKFEVSTCEQFLKWYGDQRARRIADSSAANTDKIASLRQLYFADVDALEQSGKVQLPK